MFGAGDGIIGAGEGMIGAGEEIIGAGEEIIGAGEEINGVGEGGKGVDWVDKAVVEEGTTLIDVDKGESGGLLGKAGVVEVDEADNTE